MSKVTKFNHINDSTLSLVSRDVAWNLANTVAWRINMAAKQQHQLNEEAVDRPLNGNILIEDAVRANLGAVVDIIDGALLDGITDEQLSEHIEAAVSDLGIPNGALLKKIKNSTKYEDLALSNLALQMGGAEYAALEGAELKAAARKEIQAIKSAKSQNLIDRAHDNLEWADIAHHITFNLLTPASGEEISGDGDFSDYLDIRQKAFLQRMKNLRSNQCFINEEYHSRYDDNGNLIAKDAMSMDGAFTILLDEAVLLKIDVATIDALPTQADIDKKKEQLHSVA